MQIIPIKPVPNQQIYWNLRGIDVSFTDFKRGTVDTKQADNAKSGGNVQIDVRQRRTGLFADLYFKEKLIVAGVICQDRNVWVRSAYLGFPGDIAFVDQLGTSDPEVDGLGSRFLLCYFSLSEKPFEIIVPEG